MKTTQQFIEETGSTMTASRADANPHMTDFQGDHWRCVLKLTGKGKNPFAPGTYLGENWAPPVKQLTVYFSKGYGHNGAEPTADEVLDCLASDAASIENARGFEDWASDLGYDPDSRKAEKIFKACERQTAKLKAFLGEDRYQELLWEVERG